MATEPLISVVVPVYNGEMYVKSCLENILGQSYKSLEVIVVDDGSEDASPEIAKNYPVRLIKHEKNRGLSAARNTGIDAAKGDYIHFLDVDDTVNEEYYEKMLSAIIETGADIACGGMINEAKRYKTRVYKKREVLTSVPDKLELTYVGKWGYVWRYLFSLDFLKKQQLRFEEGRFMEDLIFSLPAVFHANKVVVVPGAEYTYIHRENSIMTKRDVTHRKKRHEDWRFARSFRKEFAKKHNIKIPGVDTGRVAYILRKIFS